ncbi:hypothetical protein [Aquibacillus kalidii]|uniref:hypothetical protein n=1 Tax=Aquibacillus kalidii TaxID=2762597 RepID=UPI001647B3DF|nr:hypothetical protein [Aquibacillus kalidii]
MATNNLNDEEKNTLLQLSHFELPIAENQELSLREIWKKAIRYSDENGGEYRSYPNSPTNQKI